MRFYIFLIIFLFSTNSRSDILFQDPTSNGINAAYESRSRDFFINAKISDDPKTLFLTGLLFLKGDDEFNFSQNCKKASLFLQKSWDEGVVDAGYALSTMYYRGLCVEKK